MSRGWSKFFIVLILIAALGILGFFQYKVLSVRANGVSVQVDGRTFVVQPDDLGFPKTGFDALLRFTENKPMYDQSAMQAVVSQVADKIDLPAKDLNVAIANGQVGLDTQTEPGRVLERAEAEQALAVSLNNFQNNANFEMVDQPLTVTLGNAEQTLANVRDVLRSGIQLNHSGDKIQIGPEQIGSWIQTKPDGAKLDITFNDQKILADLARISAKYEQQPQELDFQMQDDKVTDFQAPIDGVTVDKDTAKDTIIALLKNREDGVIGMENPIELTDQIEQAGVSDRAKSLGIKEMIGTATTTFAGSTKNRVINIKNGAAKLNGSLVKSGDEFSTINLLGAVDAEHGFVPELVIKGPQTIPEFGGGLCQVSTTLFRAVLNSGLPVTERQNHSYRVSFYEKDGNGKSIGPGLDATIYDPHPDFKFKNDTTNSILVTDQVLGNKITFTIYGTGDGRSAKVIGPTILELIKPQQDPAVEVTQGLQAGQEKQVEFAITGAKTTATYEVTYADGTVKKQVFNSYYHPVQAKYQVGVPAVAGTTSGTATSGTSAPTTAQ